MLLNHLFEAKLSPGDRKAIQLKINDYQKALDDVSRHVRKLSSIGNAPVIPGTEKELEDLKKAYQDMIDRLKAKLNEPQEEDDLERYMKAIVKNCKTVVSACKRTDMLLYRGTKETAPAFYGKPFDERYAKDSNRNLSDAFNSALADAGVIARRDNSMFTTTNKSFAQGFGHNLYIIFPRDPMHFTWSDKIKDLVINEEFMFDMVDPETVKDIMRAVWSKPETKEAFIEAFRTKGYHHGATIGFDFDNYPSNSTSADYTPFTKYNFQTSVEALRGVLPLLGPEYQRYDVFKNWVDAEAIIKNFGLHIDEDLEGAFKQRYEITVRAEYYAIEAKHEKRVREYLGMAKTSNW